MNLNSWTPEDKARRSAVVFSNFIGSFTFIAAMAAYELGFFMSLLIYFVVTAVLFFISRIFFRMIFK